MLPNQAFFSQKNNASGKQDYLFSLSDPRRRQRYNS